MKISCKHIIHQDELKTATQSLRIIFEVVQTRIRNIAGKLRCTHGPFSLAESKFVPLAIFEQKNLDVSIQLKTFAFGMVSSTVQLCKCAHGLICVVSQVSSPQ